MGPERPSRQARRYRASRWPGCSPRVVPADGGAVVAALGVVGLAAAVAVPGAVVLPGEAAEHAESPTTASRTTASAKTTRPPRRTRPGVAAGVRAPVPPSCSIWARSIVPTPPHLSVAHWKALTGPGASAERPPPVGLKSLVPAPAPDPPRGQAWTYKPPKRKPGTAAKYSNLPQRSLTSATLNMRPTLDSNQPSRRAPVATDL